MTWVLDYVVLKDAVYESYVICAFFSAMAMMLFARARTRSFEAKRRRKRATSVDRWYDRFDDMIDVDCTLCIDCAYFTAAAATATVPPPPPLPPPTAT